MGQAIFKSGRTLGQQIKGEWDGNFKALYKDAHGLGLIFMTFFIVEILNDYGL